jgi:hypothetical protein
MWWSALADLKYGAERQFYIYKKFRSFLFRKNRFALFSDQLKQTNMCYFQKKLNE